MDLKIKGKNAVVLGGTRGIGRAVAEAFADEGTNVAICARNEEQVARAVSELSAKPVRVTGRCVDVTDGPAVREWVRAVAEELGGIDILVSNAGAMAQGIDFEAWERNYRLDILGAISAFEAAQPFLQAAAKEKGDAAVVLVGSIAATESKFGGAYGAIKAALASMSKSLAINHAQDHIRVNTVSPGMVYFEGSTWDQLKENMPDVFEDIRSSARLGHPASPHHIADSVVFLCSPRSFCTTGANLLIDSGQSNRVSY